MSATKLLEDTAHDDAIAHAAREISKLRHLLAKYMCNCKRFTLALPVDPEKHAPACQYREAMQ